MRESGARQTAQEFCVNDGVPQRQTPAFAIQKGIAFRGFGGPLVLPPLMVPSQQPHGHQMGPDGGPGRNQGKDARQKKASVCSVLCSFVHSFVRPLIHSFIRQKLAEPPPRASSCARCQGRDGKQDEARATGAAPAVRASLSFRPAALAGGGAPLARLLEAARSFDAIRGRRMQQCQRGHTGEGEKAERKSANSHDEAVKTIPAVRSGG